MRIALARCAEPQCPPRALRASPSRNWGALRGTIPATEPGQWRHQGIPAHRPPYFPRPGDRRAVISHASYAARPETPGEPPPNWSCWTTTSTCSPSGRPGRTASSTGPRAATGLPWHAPNGHYGLLVPSGCALTSDDSGLRSASATSRSGATRGHNACNLTAPPDARAPGLPQFTRGACTAGRGARRARGREGGSLPVPAPGTHRAPRRCRRLRCRSPSRPATAP